MIRYCLLLVVVVVGVVVEAQDQCQDQRTCSACIQTRDCMWCSKPKSEEGKEVQHCQSNTIDQDSFCDRANLENPQNSAEAVQNEPLTEITEPGTKKGEKASEGDIIQISPQKMKLKLRKGVPQNISIKYRLATDYPVDLYYLMDLSNSMSNDKDNLAKLGSTLAELLGNLTSQFRMGFGSFVDKVLMPYADTSPEKIRQPCSGCAPPYSYRNDLGLTSDTVLFAERVKGATISGNMDAPEGGFDALMQAMVCKEEVGWRDQARKIIIFSTDAKFHYAGDGRLAGIIEPNDETCHMENSLYTDYDKYDYPSIAQIDKVSTFNDIYIIFAVINHGDLYEKLSGLVTTSTYGLLNEGSKNIIGLVKNQYEKISSVVRLNDNSNSGLRLEYQARCQKNGDLVSTRECTGVKTGDDIEFFLQITANECPSDGAATTVVVKTLEDSLILEIEFECTCGCNSQEHNIPKAKKCNGNGTLVCGVCHCDQGYMGETCQCSNDGNEEIEDQDQERCKANINATQVCSNHGHCSCGVCICDQGFHGTYCNCNRLKCVSGNQVCSGHGTCQCNTCECDQGYMGELCFCPESSVCVKPGSQKQCSGHGECKCGRCKCSQEEGIVYTGRYCEDCQTCSSGRCFDFRDCVQCQSFNSGPLSQDNRCSTCNITSSLIDNLKGQQAGGASPCSFEDEEGCRYYFTYRYNSDTTPGSGTQLYDIYVKKERDCPEAPPVFGIVFGLIAAIVAIGLLTLIIWKVVTTIHDRREYAKFETERENAQWNTEENPLYRGAQTTFQNPAFAQQQAQ